jgi:hypothetical protein
MTLKVVVLLSLLALGFATTVEETQAALANAEAQDKAEALTELEMEVEAEAEVEASALPINCADAKVRGISNRDGNTGSGVYRVKPLDGGKSFLIFCEYDAQPFTTPFLPLTTAPLCCRLPRPLLCFR